MGQKTFKNFSYPQDCINVNAMYLSDKNLDPQADSKQLLKQANSQLQTVLPRKLSNALNKLTFLTYNVWFEYFNEENRVPCLLKLLNTSEADFICLQEVTAGFMKHLLQATWFTAKYLFSGYQISWDNEEKIIPKEYKDIWMVLKEAPKETMPKTIRYKEWRPDRILIKSEKWQPTAIDRVGDFTIPPYEH
ncbi:unnamed protein product [Sphagnum balticum]